MKQRITSVTKNSSGVAKVDWGSASGWTARSTGSTVISQFFDTFIVLGIAFYATGKMDTETYIASGFTGYFVKLIIAICLTPLIYLGHSLIHKHMEPETVQPEN